MSEAADYIREHAARLAPSPTNVAPQLEPLDGIRAVLFDVYGTLFVSGCGDISIAEGSDSMVAFGPSLAEVGLTLTADEAAAREIFHTCVREHQASLADRFPSPEVDIVSVWKDVVAKLTLQKFVAGQSDRVDCRQLALAYEMCVNPVWSMPGLVECCETIREAGLALGIVSNAQFFTRELFAGMCGRTLAELGFDDELCVWSYEHLRAKPDTFLYELAAGALATRGISPRETLYVGNDMRNDVMPAAKVGFRAALFAGDARSLRLREGDSSVAGVVPDRVITDLAQIIGILGLAQG